MYRKYLIRSALVAALTTLAGLVAGQNPLETIPLRYRTADQVLPSLWPLLERGGTLTGQGNQLIVRTSPENLGDLKRALEAIDRPPRRLQISVRFDEALDAAAQGLEASGRVSNRSSRIDVRAQDSRTSAAGRIDQRIQVLEGARAFISTGQSSPILQGAAIREEASGFEAVARLAGDTVFLEVAPRRQALNRQQSLATTVSARLGEWFEVGGAVENAAREDRGIAANRTHASESRRVWLKVEEVRP
jgi:hypothetical protein